jgi:hypothetical protein
MFFMLELGCGSRAVATGEEEAAVTATEPEPKRKAPGTLPLETPHESTSTDGGRVELGSECPPDAPYFCRDECRPTACPASCERTGCPSAFECKDCGDGFACVPRDAC